MKLNYYSEIQLLHSNTELSHSDTYIHYPSPNDLTLNSYILTLLFTILTLNCYILTLLFTILTLNSCILILIFTILALMV